MGKPSGLGWSLCFIAHRGLAGIVAIVGDHGSAARALRSRRPSAHMIKQRGLKRDAYQKERRSMAKRIDKSWIIFDSIENDEHNRCVDLFERPEGTFGFEEFRRDV